MRVLVAGAEGSELTDAVAGYLDAPVVVERLNADALAGFDLLVSAGYHYLLHRPVLDAVPTVGVHPGMLPKYRGSHPLWWALRNEERTVGLTSYLLDEGIDSGPILEQVEVLVERGDTFASLYARTVERVPDVLGPVVDHFAATGHLPPGREQDDAAASVYRVPTTWQRAFYKGWWQLRRVVVAR